MTPWDQVQTVAIPDGQPLVTVNVYSLSPHGGPTPSGLSYIQWVRCPSILRSISESQERDVEAEYFNDLPGYVWAFSELLPQHLSPEAITVAPSRRLLAAPYMEVAAQRFPGARDLSIYVHKIGETSAAESQSFDEVLESIRYTGPRQDGLQSLLIVDDMLASGRTAAAMVSRLRALGMPSGAAIAVAVALRVIR
ncbi:MAG: hypothetical protein A3A44_03450 [Candidatus Sungbacteria bacterium RIFCSPLOWO2_01_FULL_60_25]|uniref:Phosphoribosyltransferase domain-containing protein n=1 Tax=Candidatus Sungbacteria bacterium RIFCSPLOWO2_01_FULL_60_25 TaxID=1802281 RepID=A0A1G2LET0_9BACT|nr:MAG: hypothetical protein A3A44_03450 [Candidatus Sungbacteria bacterium RIFCSPLOWO2_01_FULL_60_25]